MEYPIVEIFTSIQGEGVHMGERATFVRFGGCNLSCEWCDTKFDEFKMMTVEEIIDCIDADMVIFTGGEPGMQNLLPLLEAIDEQHEIYVGIETNGTMPITQEYGAYIDHIACSPKPGSGYKIHPGCTPDELKYVVDENFTVDVIDRESAVLIPVWLQPEGNNMYQSAQKAYKMIIDNPQLNLRLGVQMHKIFKLQ